MLTGLLGKGMSLLLAAPRERSRKDLGKRSEGRILRATGILHQRISAGKFESKSNYARGIID
jgi:hypothetical protein